MNPTVKLIVTGLKLFQKFSPAIIGGLGALIAAIEGKAQAGQAVSLVDVHNLAKEHDVPMDRINSFVSDLTPKGE